MYVDDMVIKIKGDEWFLKDVEETMIWMRNKYETQSEKVCLRSVERKILRSHCFPWRVEANPEKLRTLLDLKKSCTVRDVQSLKGKLATLGRFLEKSAEQSLSFYQVVKSDVAWSKEAGEALLNLKDCLRKILILEILRPNDPLIIYLSTNWDEINAILIAEREEKQVYFVSRVLQGVELNYSLIEKLILSLVYVAKRLWSYFQAHPISVLIG